MYINPDIQKSIANFCDEYGFSRTDFESNNYYRRWFTLERIINGIDKFCEHPIILASHPSFLIAAKSLRRSVVGLLDINTLMDLEPQAIKSYSKQYSSLKEAYLIKIDHQPSGYKNPLLDTLVKGSRNARISDKRALLKLELAHAVSHNHFVIFDTLTFSPKSFHLLLKDQSRLFRDEYIKKDPR